MADYMRDEYGNAYQLPGPFDSIRAMETETHRRGGFYFAPDTVRFFSARTHELYAGALLIDSVRDTWTDRAREYRLTVLCDGGGMAHVPDPRDGAITFATLRQARAAALRVCESCGVSRYDVNREMREAEWGPVSAERQLVRRIVQVAAS